jgi:hypothetical protein
MATGENRVGSKRSRGKERKRAADIQSDGWRVGQ